MIGLVVVSHSRDLGEAVVALAAEMVAADVRPRVEVAAGLPDGSLGTDAAAVAEAVTRADSPDGVLVLLDLGSALLSAEMALEFLDPDLAARTRLSAAPLVEGLVAAVVTAAGGADLATVAAEAARGTAAKDAHLAEGSDGGPADLPGGQGADADPPVDPAGRPADLLRVVVDVPHGLHARPVARLVGVVAAHPSTTVRVRNATTGAGPVDGLSLSQVAGLGVREGHEVEFAVTGDGSRETVAALEALAQEGFGDRPTAPERATSSRADGPSPDGARPDGPDGDGPQGGPGAGSALGSGVGAAIGPVVRAAPAPERSRYQASGDPAEEDRRLQDALARTGDELSEVARQAVAGVGVQDAAIFAAHLALLRDPALTGPAQASIASGVPAVEAWHDAVAVAADGLAAVEDVYLQDRAEDVRSVGERVERVLLGLPAPDLSRAEGILVVRELDPATATQLDPTRITGVVTIGGGATGHGAIVASARGVPVLTGAGSRADVAAGTVLAFDERTRELWVDPDEDTRATFQAMMADRVAAHARAQERAGEPGTTLDGHRVEVKANVNSAQEAAQAARAGAEGSGLVRTEVLFGRSAHAPTVSEQVRAFTAIAEALEGPVTIRTWDIGADKPLPFHPQEPELNPFLGVRGIRAFRDRPGLLLDQLEAVVRVAQERPLRVMFPMVGTVEEVDWALARLEEATTRVTGTSVRPPQLQVGIMVEVPAAALRAEALSAQLDFVSIGTNDLTQYVLAAERGSAVLEGLTDAVDPAVLRLVAMVCQDVAEGVRVGVCGGAAGDPVVAGLLVGLGVQELSATPAGVPDVKAALRSSSLTDLQDLAQRALHCDSAAEVRALLR